MSQLTAKWLHRTLRKKHGNASLSRLAAKQHLWKLGTRNSKPHVKNRCLHGFGECRGALIPHLVVSDTEDLQGGVGLAMLHSSNRTTQHTSARMLSHNAAPAWSKIHPQRRPCEDSHNLSATTRPVCCTRTCRLNLRPTMPNSTCVEGRLLAEMSRYQHILLNGSTTVQHAWPCHEVLYQSVSRYVVTWRSKTSVCVNVLDYNTPARSGRVTSIRIPSKRATICQVCFRAVSLFKAGVFRKLLMSCSVT